MNYNQSAQKYNPSGKCTYLSGQRYLFPLAEQRFNDLLLFHVVGTGEDGVDSEERVASLDLFCLQNRIEYGCRRGLITPHFIVKPRLFRRRKRHDRTRDKDYHASLHNLQKGKASDVPPTTIRDYWILEEPSEIRVKWTAPPDDSWLFYSPSNQKEHQLERVQSSQPEPSESTPKRLRMRGRRTARFRRCDQPPWRPGWQRPVRRILLRRRFGSHGQGYGWHRGRRGVHASPRRWSGNMHFQKP